MDGASSSKLPEDKAFFSTMQPQLGAPQAAPSTVAGQDTASKAEVTTSAPVEVDDEDDEMDEERQAALLGLAIDPSKRKRKGDGKGGKSKKMRTKEELYNEELEKMEVELSSLQANLVEFPKKPTGYEIGQLDRKLNTKLKQMRDAGHFDGVAKVEACQKVVRVLRDSVKAALAFLPAKGLPKKQHEDKFFETFKSGLAECPEVINNFPAVVIQQFSDLDQDKQIKAKNWTMVAANLAQERLSKIYEGSEEVAEKQSITSLERAVATIMELEADEACSNLLELCEKVQAAKPVPAIATQLPMLVQLVQLDLRGHATFDSLLNTLNEQSSGPIFRVIFSTQVGKSLISKAEESNAGLQMRATKMTTLSNLKDSCQFAVFHFGFETCSESR